MPYDLYWKIVTGIVIKSFVPVTTPLTPLMSQIATSNQLSPILKDLRKNEVVVTM